MSLSRSSLARHLAELMASDNLDSEQVEAAAMIVKQNSIDVGLLNDDIKFYIETDHKVSNPTVVSARSLSDVSKSDITKLVKDQTNTTVGEVDYRIDESLIGGAKVTTATTAIDMTVKTMLSNIQG